MNNGYCKLKTNNIINQKITLDTIFNVFGSLDHSERWTRETEESNSSESFRFI